MSDPVAVFGAIAERLLSEDGVTEGTGFGANAGLRVGGKIFAMLVRASSSSSCRRSGASSSSPRVAHVRSSAARGAR